MSRSLLVLALLAIAAIVGDAYAPYRIAELHVALVSASGATENIATPLTQAVVLDSRSAEKIQIRAANRSYSVGGHVRVDASGSKLLAHMNGSENVRLLGPGQQNCSHANTTGLWSCRIPFRLNSDSWLELDAISGGVSVIGIETTVVKASAVAQAGVGSLFIFFAALSILGLVMRSVRLAINTQELLLAAAGMIWLVASGGVGGAALIALMVVFFVLLRFQLANPSSVGRIGLTVAAVVMVFALAKVFGSIIANSFANPGALAFGIPLGFAFFIIRILDTSFRVGTREIASLSLRDFLCYIFFPATLAAGPIFQLRQFRESRTDGTLLVDWSSGLARMTIGVSKKIVADVILAKVVVPYSVLLYSGPLEVHSSKLWILLLANALYVYLDFSGYSDMAIGVARQLGWRVPENFEFPFLQGNLRRFWQCWHITLSTWVSRWIHFFTAFSLRRSSGFTKAVLPVTVSLLVIGLWHEIQLTWIAWGLHHSVGVILGDGIALVASRFAIATPKVRVLSMAKHACGMAFVFAWVALSHCFTLISDPLLALQIYVRALSFGLL